MIANFMELDKIVNEEEDEPIKKPSFGPGKEVMCRTCKKEFMYSPLAHSSFEMVRIIRNNDGKKSFMRKFDMRFDLCYGNDTHTFIGP